MQSWFKRIFMSTLFSLSSSNLQVKFTKVSFYVARRSSKCFVLHELRGAGGSQILNNLKF